jgi:hypothetical protein
MSASLRTTEAQISPGGIVRPRTAPFHTVERELCFAGIVPSSRLAAGNVPVGTAYGYPITDRLEGTKGTGARKGGRPCSVTFTKQ